MELITGQLSHYAPRDATMSANDELASDFIDSSIFEEGIPKPLNIKDTVFLCQ